MEYAEAVSEGEANDPNAIIVKADEVDESGADISTISPTDATDSEFNERIESRRAQDAQAGGSPKILANAVPSPPRPLSRPTIRRNGSAPLPPQQPPPPAPPQQQQDEGGNSTDSLSLQQLKKLVTDLPKLEPTAYAYEYTDTREFPEELEEWFQYSDEERYMLLRAKQTFDEKWEQGQAARIAPPEKTLQWTDVEAADRENFLVGALQALTSTELSTRVKSLECISYIALGVWGDTAGLVVEDEEPEKDIFNVEGDSQYSKSKLQLRWIVNGAKLLCRIGALQKLFDVLTRSCDNEKDSENLNDLSPMKDEEMASMRFLKQIEINQVLTALYCVVEVGRWQISESKETSIRQAITDLTPDFLAFLTRTIAKLRWEDSSPLPVSRIILLFWKAVLLVFGSTEEVKKSKAALREASDEADNEHGEGFITTSPLDYHLFRQEITSKYPAYSPPPPLLPIELENNSILPPLPTHSSRRVSQESLQLRAGVNVNGTAGSIFNQPVHIATPAPSPPPSPAGPGGKGGKKQNYQTNQNFPFLYPPLDDTTNIVGGKGSATLQDQLVEKRWDGNDVPASIQEAGQLFASRMRMSRSIRQLWDVREKFITYERGWNEDGKDDELSNTEKAESNMKGDELSKKTEYQIQTPELEKETDNEDVQRRLDAVENFYRYSLPHLQSVVIVLWKAVFANVSALVTQSNGQNGVPNNLSLAEDNSDASQGKRNINGASAIHLNGLANGQLANNEDGTDPAVEELNAIRLREITSKAIFGVLLMLLKWFKLSHILKFEYLNQLLLDANYLPLILKLFAHQDIDRAVDQKNDREDLDFFNFCHSNSRHPPTTPPQPSLSPSTSSDDEAQPPAIPKHRRSPASRSPPPSPPLPTDTKSSRPEVDELGYPMAGTLPTTPLTTYSPRFFFTTITLLRLLQKITKRKAHRALLLVQYKSSTILRKALKIPQPELRLYTLKLFKSQVPYCGRKWRQTNMRVITAIYLHCKPELRDEWLCGGDVDGVVEEAVPLEQAGRALVHWWHLRNYRAVMEGKERREEEEEEGEEVTEEDNFFARELEKMGWGVAGMGGGEGEDEEGAQVQVGGSEWDGGPLQMEGWA